MLIPAANLSLLGIEIDPVQAGWTILAGVLCNTTCALLGCYLVLRRMSLLGDAVSHSVLPGLVIGVLVAAWGLAGRGEPGGEEAAHVLGSPLIFLGAVVAALATAGAIQLLNRSGQVAEDAGMGVVYTAFFAVGVVLMTQFANDVHLDPDCLLYGLIEIIPFDTLAIGGVEIPRAFLTLVPVCLATVLFINVGWKELQLTAFDPQLAAAMGYPVQIVHLSLLAMVAVAAVASFEAVGSILVIAMLIVPAATAQLLTDRLDRMLWGAAACGASAAFWGYLGALAWDTSVAGMMAVVAGVQLGLAVVAAPRHGVVAKMLGQLKLALQIVTEDLIALLYRVEERRALAGSAGLSLAECRRLIGGGWLAWLAVPFARWKGFVQAPAAVPALTDAGRTKARSLVRSHRLWEAYLEKHFNLPLDHLHAPASRVEHYIGADLQAELEAELDLPERDPHGTQIPRSE